MELPTQSFAKRPSALPPRHSRVTGYARLHPTAAGIGRGGSAIPRHCSRCLPQPAQVRLTLPCQGGSRKAPQGAGQSGDLQRTRCSSRWLPLLGTPITATSRGTLRQAQTDTGALPGRESREEDRSLPETSGQAAAQRHARSLCATAGAAA